MSTRKTVFVFVGPPGSGKGSLSQLCVKELDWAQLSTGNLCRKHISEQTEVGKQIDLITKSGKLVPDELIVSMVRDGLADSLALKECVIFDGFPRTTVQAESLGGLLREQFNSSALKIVRLIASDDTVIDRLTNRYICENNTCQAVYSLAKGSTLAPKKHMICDNCSGSLKKRNDDTRESIKKRLEIYHQHEKTLLDFYQQQESPIVEISVEKPIEVVFENFKKLMGLSKI